MFSRLLPKQYGFFELFNRHARTTLDGAREFVLAVEEWPDKGDARFRCIKELEHECDSITHMTVDLIHRTFITPLDRDEILALISKMDDVMDCVETAGSRIMRFKIGKVPGRMVEMARVLAKAEELVAKTVEMLQGFKHVDEMRDMFKEVHRLEGEGDELVHAGVAALFEDHADDPLLVIKLKEIYEIVERGIDECEDVANIIEGIALEHS
ncbi:MAG TPA: DUF47 family protein [Myxococcota bacterium]|nr:DUF47 family protein [Myxococcota bacterium]HRY97153.1 DUF47 family protein [Myxococcota bacterium]HSA21395.1 DUF47 family protein [Myxococcota bacterium]